MSSEKEDFKSFFLLLRRLLLRVFGYRRVQIFFFILRRRLLRVFEERGFQIFFLTSKDASTCRKKSLDAVDSYGDSGF